MPSPHDRTGLPKRAITIFLICCIVVLAVLLLLLAFDRRPVPLKLPLAGGSSQETVSLSAEEREYLRGLGPVLIAVDPDWEPYEQIIAGQYRGIAADLVHLIFSRLQVPYRLVPTRDWDESLEAAKDGRVHLLAFLNKTAERERWLDFTDPYFTDPNVLITRTEHPFITDLAALSSETVALPGGTSMEERLRAEHPHLKILLVPNEADAFAAVEQKRADIALRSLTMAAYVIRKEGLFNLKIAGQMPGYANSLRMGVVKGHPMLVRILNKGIATLTAQEIQQAVNRHVSIEVSTHIDRKSIIWASVILTILIGMGSVWIVLLKRINRRLVAQELALRQSQQMLGYIVEHLNTAVAVLDRDRRFIYVSRLYTALFRIPGNPEHRRFDDLHDTHQAFLSEAIGRALDGIVSNGDEDTYCHFDNSSVVIRWECRPWFLVDGSIGGALLYVEDISARKEFEKRLQSSEELHRLLTEYSSDVIWILNMRSRRFTYISPAVRQLRGYSVAEAIGQDLQQSLVPDSYEMIMERFPAALREFLAHPKEPKTHYAQVQQPCRDGSVIWVEFSMKYRLNGSGQIEAVGVSRNIEERKRAEREITYLSYHDQLTGLFNRRYYEENLLRYDTADRFPLTLVMADVNGLKHANDSEGHDVGDALLTTVARELERTCRPEDIVARIGGDEYVMLLPKTTSEEAARVVSGIEERLRGKRVASSSVSVSFGWATKYDTDVSIAKLFKTAEDMMYRRKRSESNSRTAQHT